MKSPFAFLAESKIKRTHLQVKKHYIDQEIKHFYTVGMNYFRQHLRECMALLIEREAIIITNNGKKTAVLLDYASYERMIRHKRIILDGGLSHAISPDEAEFLTRL